MSFTVRARKRSARSGASRGRIIATALIVAAMLVVGTAPAWAHVVPATGGQALAAGGANHATRGAPSPSTSEANADLFGSLGGGDPFCQGPPGGGTLTAAQQADCRVSGSVSERYPISSYGIDVQSPNGLGSIGTNGLASIATNGLGSIGSWIGYTFQSIGAVIWEVLLYALRGVLLLLQWAFALDLVGKAMGGIRSALGILHNDVFGDAWLEAALSVLALWGMWNGLVRRRTIDTVAGLLTTVVMIVAALVLIAEPGSTVGTLSNYANQASLTTLSAVSRGNVAHPATTFASSEGDLFTALVERPWCALEFGSVSYCGESSKGGGGTTVADVWLSSPANSAARQQLYALATTGSPHGRVPAQATSTILDLGQAATGNPGGAAQAVTQFLPLSLCPNGAAHCPAATVADTDIKNHPRDVQMQGTGGNMFDRLTLLTMIVVGLSGAIAVLLYIGLKLLFAAIKILLLILGAPVMLIIAAFGESGRATCTAYGKSLLGAALTKLVFAVALAIVLLTAGIINGLRLGWFSLWLLNGVFWWGVFFERRKLVQFLEMDKRVADNGLDITGRGAPFRVTGALIGGFAAFRAARGLTRGVAALPRAGTWMLRGRTLDRRTAGSAAHMRALDEHLDDRATRGIDAADRDRIAEARSVLNLQRTGVLDEFNSKVQWARSTAARLGGDKPRVIDRREREAWNEQRRSDLAIGEFPDSALEPDRFRRSLNAAGITHTNWSGMAPADQADAVERAKRQEHDDRRDFALRDNPHSAAGLPLPTSDLETAWRQASEEGPAVYERVAADAEKEYQVNRELRAHRHRDRQGAGRARSRRGPLR